MTWRGVEEFDSEASIADNCDIQSKKYTYKHKTHELGLHHIQMPL